MASFQSTVDADAGTASLALIVGGQPPFTVYSFVAATGQFTLSERLVPVAMPLADARTLLEAIRVWTEIVYRLWRPVWGQLPMFAKELAATAGEIAATCTIDGVPVLVGTWDRTTLLMTFDPRLEAVLGWSGFRYWFTFLDEYTATCEAA